MQEDEPNPLLWDSIINNIKPLVHNKVLFDYSNQLVNLDISRDNQTNTILKFTTNLESCNIDYNTKLKVNRGKYFLDDKLDLHGYNSDRAYTMLTDFIAKHYYIGSRCLLIITGWGKRSNPGMIRNNLANWLASDKIRHMVLYYTQAINAHGGKGAFYILLRRIRNF